LTKGTRPFDHLLTLGHAITEEVLCK